MIRLESVTKKYKSGRQKVFAVKDISLDISDGDYVSVVGPSGAGKSTLLHILGGLDSPSSGKVIFNDRDLYRMWDRDLSLWRYRRVGFVFQFYHLIEELNVFDNISVAAFSEKRKYRLSKVKDLLKYLGIEDRATFFPSQLSGGERQKVAIARALVNEPDIILCDEPTGNLDRDSQKAVIDFLEKLNEERAKTVVIVTHNLELASRARKSIFIEDGEIISMTTNIKGDRVS